MRTIACAHNYQASNNSALQKVANFYPNKYIVTDDQVSEAKRLLKEAKINTLIKHKNDLLFCSMGMGYEARFEDDVCNHRIRTEFLNKNGKRFFVEFGTGLNENLRCDHSIDRDLEIEFEQKRIEAYANRDKLERKTDEWYKADLIVQKYNQQPFHNYSGLERLTDQIKYTNQNILEIVNKTFDCEFKSIVISDLIHPNDRDIICFSPKATAIVKQLSLF